MISITRFSGFRPIFSIVGCYCEFEGKILLLHRQDHKPHGGTWCLPAGKVNSNEFLRDAMSRELSEETGLLISEDYFQKVEKVFVRYSQFDFIYHLYRARVFTDKVKVRVAEHKAYLWVTPRNALLLPLIEDEGACMQLAYPHLF